MGIFKLVKNGFIVTKIGAKAGVNVTKGIIGAASDVVNAGNALMHGNEDKVIKIFDKRISNVANGICGAFQSTAYVSNRVMNKLADKDSGEFLDKETQKHLERLASIAVISAIGISGLDYDYDGNTDYHYDDGLVSNAELSGIENGMFIGNENNLVELIKAGEIQGTEHIDSDEYDRDLSARDQFLQMHGFSSVPSGYEVHHIIPLCEGGANSPENMVIIDENLHEKITQAHAVFYGWHSA